MGSEKAPISSSKTSVKWFLNIFMLFSLIIGGTIALFLSKPGQCITHRTSTFIYGGANIRYNLSKSYHHLDSLDLNEIENLSISLENIKIVKRNGEGSKSEENKTSDVKTEKQKKTTSKEEQVNSSKTTSTANVKTRTAKEKSSSKEKTTSSTSSSTASTSTSSTESSSTSKEENKSTPILDQPGIRFAMVLFAFIFLNMLAICIHHIYQKLTSSGKSYRTVEQNISPF